MPFRTRRAGQRQRDPDVNPETGQEFHDKYQSEPGQQGEGGRPDSFGINIGSARQGRSQDQPQPIKKQRQRKERPDKDIPPRNKALVCGDCACENICGARQDSGQWQVYCVRCDDWKPAKEEL